MEVSLQSFRKRFTYDPQKDLLGKGGFGEVYKAYDNEDQVYVALKISQGTADDKYNLINEIKQFKKLNHPNIVNHIEAYEVNTGSTDIHGKPILYHVGILEYADKGTLADFLKSKTPTGFRQTIEDLANDIIDGLAYLHSQNIIHRDLKPTNILLFSDGEKLRAKITDFGIAKKADATAASTQLVGTVEYMAPEYFTTGNITKASDIWSLGVMLLEALSGTHPFGKTTQGLSNEQIIRNILSKDLQENLANAPLKELLTRCLLRDASLRPQSAEELKGLMLSGEDAFTERTQIINTKKKVSETENGKPKWKKLVAALFDFDLRNGKCKKVLARELVTSLSICLASIALPLMLYTILLGVSTFRINALETQRASLQITLDSIKSSKHYDSYKMSKAYFRRVGNQQQIRCYTPLGLLYTFLRKNGHSVSSTVANNSLIGKYVGNINHVSIENSNVFFDKKENEIFADVIGTETSYEKFVFDINGVNFSTLYALENDVKLFFKDDTSFNNYSIVEEIKSVSNLSLNDGSYILDKFSSPYLISSFSCDNLPRIIFEKLNISGWTEWFFKNRVNNLLVFKSYLIIHNAETPEKFKNFMLQHHHAGDYIKTEIAVQKINDKIEQANELWGYKMADGEAISITVVLLFILFYPIRIFTLIIFWALKTLRNS